MPPPPAPESRSRLLLIDAPSPASERLAKALIAGGHEVLWAQAPEAATELLAEDSVEVVLGAFQGGAENVLLEALRLPDGPELVLFEDFGEVAEAFEDIRRGAFDTLARPVPDDEVLRVVQRALDHRRIVADNRRLRSALGERFELGELVSRDAEMGRIFGVVEAVADSPVSLLIEGESGTGKTVLARAVHARSSRADAPFVGVNCGAIPDALLESELFGHVRGAFTGAVRDREGKFEAAEGGTIFLDEVGTASPDLQVKLLRILEEGLFERVGESRTRSADVRVIAATNVDLAEEVRAGRFRADLYYRLHVVGIEVPPLRRRVADVPLLAERFLRGFAERYGRDSLRFTPNALQALCAHPWPGNVRELENRLERAVLLTPGEVIDATDLWSAGAPDTPSVGNHGVAATGRTARADDGQAPRLEDMPLGPLKPNLLVAEAWLLRRALEFHGGQRIATAATLGINRTTLFNKMKRHGLLQASFEPRPD